MSRAANGHWSGDPDRKVVFQRRRFGSDLAGRSVDVPKEGRRGPGPDLRYTLIECPGCHKEKRPNAFSDPPYCRACHNRGLG